MSLLAFAPDQSTISFRGTVLFHFFLPMGDGGHVHSENNDAIVLYLHVNLLIFELRYLYLV